MTDFKKVSILEDHDTYTTSNATGVPEVSLDSLSVVYDQLQDSFLGMFSGMNVMVDTNLKGNDWYVAVSQDVADQLAKKGSVAK